MDVSRFVGRLVLALVAAGFVAGCTSEREAGSGTDRTMITAEPSGTADPTVVTQVAGETTEETEDTVAATVLAQPAEPIRIMPLGDSITEQSPYRNALLTLLDEGGCSYDFVGSKKDLNFVDGRDPDHEGHGGWAADQIAAEARAWAEASRPQVVLLHIGTNDFYRGETVETTVEDVRQIIAELRAGAPEVTVLLGQIIPGVGLDELVDEYNLALASLAVELDSPASAVTAVDVFNGFDWQFDTVDEVHPTDEGGNKIATRWYATLSTLPQLGCAA